MGDRRLAESWNSLRAAGLPVGDAVVSVPFLDRAPHEFTDQLRYRISMAGKGAAKTSFVEQ